MEKKEAMKILKDFHDKSALFSVRTALETLHPEFAESEDERMVNQLHSWMNEFGGAEEYTEKVYQWLKGLIEKQGTSYTKKDVDDAYVEGMVLAKNELEKQGEKKSSDEVLKIRQELYQSGYNDGYKHGCEDTKKQGEQKSDTNCLLSWSEIDEKMFQSLEGIVKDYWAKAEQEKNEIKIREASNVSYFLKTIQKSPLCWIKCSDGLPNKDGTYLVVTDGKHNDVYDLARYDSIDGWHKASEILYWMPIPQLNNKSIIEHKSADWSEEDEKIRKALIEYFNEQCDMSDWNGVYGYQVVAWLEKQGQEKHLSEPIKDYQGSFTCWNNAHDFRPKHLQRCICYDKYMRGVYCYVYDDISKYWCTQTTEEHDQDGDNHICDYADYRVTVWMPLPNTSFYSSKTWLEKQGEQKSTDEDMKEALRTEYEKGRADAIAEIRKKWDDCRRRKDILSFLESLRLKEE